MEHRQTVTLRQRVANGSLIGRPDLRTWFVRLLIVALVIAGAWAVYNGYDFGMGLR
jgi:hypothetical protein